MDFQGGEAGMLDTEYLNSSVRGDIFDVFYTILVESILEGFTKCTIFLEDSDRLDYLGSNFKIVRTGLKS